MILMLAIGNVQIRTNMDHAVVYSVSQDLNRRKLIEDVNVTIIFVTGEDQIVHVNQLLY